MGDLYSTCQPKHFANWLNRREMMSVLHCKAGDLAITVRAEMPKNIGNIVHVLRHDGIRNWSTFGEVNIWFVEVLPSSNRLLHYFYADGQITTSRQGLVPDIFLRPIIPPNRDELVTEWLKNIFPRPRDIADGILEWYHKEEGKSSK
jgi:hypothetical protein